MRAGILVLAGALAATTAAAHQAPPPPQEPQNPPAMSTGETSKTVEGKVEAYTAGKSITVVKKDGATATFTIPEKLVVTDNIVIGSKVMIRTDPAKANTVQSITVKPNY
jgi:hypothetical protein